MYVCIVLITVKSILIQNKIYSDKNFQFNYVPTKQNFANKITYTHTHAHAHLQTKNPMNIDDKMMQTNQTKNKLKTKTHKYCATQNI